MLLIEKTMFREHPFSPRRVKTFPSWALLRKIVHSSSAYRFNRCTIELIHAVFTFES